MSELSSVESKEVGDMNDVPDGEIILYEAEPGHPAMEVHLTGETVWLNLGQLVELFERDKSVISRHLRNVFRAGELEERSVVAKYATTAADGKTYQVGSHGVFDPAVSTPWERCLALAY